MGIYILYGNEPYLIKYHKSVVEKKIKNSINIGYFEQWTDRILPFLNTCPFFDNLRVGIVSIDSLNQIELSEKEFYELQISTAAELVISVSKVDRRSKEYRFFKEKNVLKECNKITDINKLEKILLERIKRQDGRITRDAMTLFLKKENYLECENTTLYNLFSDIERLLSYNTDITPDMVNTLITENVTENVFGIAKMIGESDIAALQKQYDVVSNPIGTLSALLREYRIAYKEKYFPASEIGVRYVTLSNIPKEELVRGMDIITEAIHGIKTGTLPEAYAFRYVINKLNSI